MLESIGTGVDPSRPVFHVEHRCSRTLGTTRQVNDSNWRTGETGARVQDTTRPIDELFERADAAWALQLRADARGRPLPNCCVLTDAVAATTHLFTPAGGAPRLRIEPGVERIVLAVEPVAMVAILWCAASSLRDGPWPTAATVEIDGHAEDDRAHLLLHDHSSAALGSTWNTDRPSDRTAPIRLLGDSITRAPNTICSPVHHDWRSSIATIALDLPKFGAHVAARA